VSISVSTSMILFLLIFIRFVTSVASLNHRSPLTVTSVLSYRYLDSFLHSTKSHLVRFSLVQLCSRSLTLSHNISSRVIRLPNVLSMKRSTPFPYQRVLPSYMLHPAASQYILPFADYYVPSARLLDFEISRGRKESEVLWYWKIEKNRILDGLRVNLG